MQTSRNADADEIHFPLRSCLRQKQLMQLHAGSPGTVWHRNRPRVHDTHTLQWDVFVSSVLLHGVAIAISMIVEDTGESALEQLCFYTCRVRCLQFLPALSLFVLLLGVNVSWGQAASPAPPCAVCWWYLAVWRRKNAEKASNGTYSCRHGVSERVSRQL